MSSVDAGLLAAVSMGECKGIKKWLARGANLHAVNRHGQTALMLCSNVETLEWLLREGLPIDARDEWGRTALFEAVARHHTQIVSLFLKQGADVNARDYGGRTPLMAGAWLEEQEAVKTISLLLSHGAEVNAVDPYGKTALIHLLEDSQYDGDRPTIATLPQREALYEEIVRLLLSYQADTGIVDAEGNTAHTYSLLRGIASVSRLL